MHSLGRGPTDNPRRTGVAEVGIKVVATQLTLNPAPMVTAMCISKFSWPQGANLVSPGVL